MIKLVDTGGQVLDLNSLGPNVGIGWNREEQATGSFVNLTHKIPGRDRVYYYGTEHGDMAVAVDLWTNAMNLEFMDSLWNDIATFAFDAYGQPKLLKLYSSFYTAQGVEKFRWVRLHESPNIEYGDLFFKMTLTFVTQDRFKYGDEKIETRSNIETTHTLKIDFKGLATPPLITLVGSGTSIKLESDGKTIVAGNMPSSGVKEMVVDAANYVGYLNGVDTIMKIPRDFLILPNRELKLTGSGLNLTMEVRYWERFL